jgi:hypothetical protein
MDEKGSVIVPTPLPVEPPDGEADEVTVCRKSNGKNPHTI